ncbi:MAG: alpha-E domain-containing protein [Nitriliruptoraceae bacterium]
MLARLAENLFWAGRYVERAEDTTRIVDVTYHTLLESPPAEIEHTWRQVLDVLSLTDEYDGELGGDRVVEFLVLDRDNFGSIHTSIANARHNIRSVRELVSTELWEVVNDLFLMLNSRDLRNDLVEQPYELFGQLRRACMTIYGVSSETMPRDDGWRIMAVGRLLERAEMTCRLIDVRYAQLVDLGGPSVRLWTTPANEDEARAQADEASEALQKFAQGADRADFHQWVAVLKSASALEAYRRRYRASMDPADVVEFLLLEPELPRSVLSCLMGAMRQLEVLCGTQPTASSRRLGRTVASLQYRDVAELFEIGLHDLLESLQEEIAAVADGVADEFFRHHPGGPLRVVGAG